VKWFLTQPRVYGFIQPELTAANDVFVHISRCRACRPWKRLREGQKISYEIVADRRSGKSSARQSARRWISDLPGRAFTVGPQRLPRNNQKGRAHGAALFRFA